MDETTPVELMTKGTPAKGEKIGVSPESASVTFIFVTNDPATCSSANSTLAAGYCEAGKMGEFALLPLTITTTTCSVTWTPSVIRNVS